MRIAVITGGAGGLGTWMARRLVEDGLHVVILDIDKSALNEVTDDLGDQTTGLVADVGDDESLVHAFSEIRDEVGPVSVLVNNAAIYPSTPFLEVPLSEYQEVVSVNQQGYFRAAQLAAPDMIELGDGAIVNVSSITLHGGWADLAPYVSTKGASVALTRALARELGPLGIRVNGVSPGAFPTAAEEIHPDLEGYEKFVIEHQALKRRGNPAEVASVVSFLVGPDSSFVTGQIIEVNGGWVMA